MEVKIVESLAEPVGKLWKNLQAKHTTDKLFSVASPLSSTPLPIYQWVIDHSLEFNNWDKFKFVLMDEMMDKSQYVSHDDQASYEGFAKRNFLNPLRQRIGLEVEVIKPLLVKLKEFHIAIDLLILALGVGGNYANVMPGTDENTGWHIAHLTPEFRQVHTQRGSKSYEGANFREFGMSLGPQQVLEARNIVVIVSGERKKELVRRLKSFNSFDPNFPLSIIYHPEVREKVALYQTRDSV